MDDKTYKKALKMHRKSTKHTSSNNHEWTPFRAAEKRYKAKFPPPDMKDVLDLARFEESDLDHGPNARSDIVTLSPVKLRSRDQRRRTAFAVPQIPGLVILPGYLAPDEQRSLIRWSLASQARTPNDTNLDIHYVLPDEGLWNCHVEARHAGETTDSAPSKYIVQPKRPTASINFEQPLDGPRPLINNVPAETLNFETLNNQPKPPLLPSSHLPPAHASNLLPKLRWANIGYLYHWGSKTYDFSRPKVDYPENVRNICKEVVATVDWQQVWDGVDDQDWGKNGPDWDTWPDTYEPDAGIVNFYQLKDTLCGHVDRSEVCSTSPLVSISLGNAAIFLIGGLTRSVNPVPILLRSGDVIIMSGPGCRRAYHGVPRILEGTSPACLQSSPDEEDWEPFAEYLRSARININVRQVFPRGFDPFTGGSR